MAKKQTKTDRSVEEQAIIFLMQEDPMEGIGAAYQTYKKDLDRAANDVLGDTPRLAHLAEDAVQDGIIRAIQHLIDHPEIPHRENFHLRAWLAKIVRNQALAILRKGEAHILLDANLLAEETEEVTEEGYITHITYNDDPLLYLEREEKKLEAKRTIQEQLTTLSPKLRGAVEQKYLKAPRPDGKDKTDKQTAEELHQPLKTVKSQLKRAKDQMREQLIQQKKQESEQDLEPDFKVIHRSGIWARLKKNIS